MSTINDITVRIGGKLYLMSTAEYDRYFEETGVYPAVVGGWTMGTPNYYADLHRPLITVTPDGTVSGIRWGNEPGVNDAVTNVIGKDTDKMLADALLEAAKPANVYRFIGVAALAGITVLAGYVGIQTVARVATEKALK